MLVRLKTPWRDGTSHIALQPLELLEKLAALIPRPYVNLIVYHGVLAPNAKWRRKVVDFGRAPAVYGRHHALKRYPPDPPSSGPPFGPSRARACAGTPGARRRLGLLTASRLSRSSDWTITSIANARRGLCSYARPRWRLFAGLLARRAHVEGPIARY